jgi:O-6-methylguanine DNA methyltransferase
MDSNTIIFKIVETPVGEFIAGAMGNACCLFEFHDRGHFVRISARMKKRYGLEMKAGNSNVLKEVEKQAMEYFHGKRKVFNLLLDQKGTPFEQSVWKELMNIPYGETRSYGEIAAKLGKPGASRAVGRANGANCIPIIVPCHRVIDSNGKLHGYGGGLWRKRWLLEHEGAIPKQMFD